MNTVLHALWGATLGRTVGLPVEGALMGALPDLPVPVLAYFHYKGSTGIERQPTWIAVGYKTTHNWWFGLALTLALFLISPKMSLLGIAFLWHGVEDAFVHDAKLPRNYATEFLYPVWRKRLHGYSASHHKWIQLVDLGLIVLVNLVFFR